MSYTDRFKPFNANVKYRGKDFHFYFSKKWKTVDNEIQKGLVQELLVKIFKQKKNTLNIDLYNNFMKSLHISIEKTESDPKLEASFERLNAHFFYGTLEQPNLVWHTSLQRLGTYEYGSDTISMSTILKEDNDTMDYVMYHEMLHKKLKYACGNGRSRHHTKEFRDLEAKFPNAELMEKKLISLIRKHKIRRWFF